MARGPKETGDKAEAASVDHEIIRELAKLLDETGLTDKVKARWRQGTVRLRG